MNAGVARGLWCAVGEAPLLVSDPLQARWLMGLDRRPPSARARRRHDLGLLPANYFRRAANLLTPRSLAELERLLSGGNILWRDEYHNLVVNTGLNSLLDVTLSGGTQYTAWFVGLGLDTDNSGLTAVAGDVLGTYTNWAEVTDYDEVNRVAWVDGGVASQTVSNSASPAEFTISATVTIGGSFLAGVNTGTGGGGLYAAGAFTAGDKLLNDNDTLSVTATFTTAAV